MTFFFNGQIVEINSRQVDNFIQINCPNEDLIEEVQQIILDERLNSFLDENNMMKIISVTTRSKLDEMSKVEAFKKLPFILDEASFLEAGILIKFHGKVHFLGNAMDVKLIIKFIKMIIEQDAFIPPLSSDRDPPPPPPSGGAAGAMVTVSLETWNEVNDTKEKYHTKYYKSKERNRKLREENGHLKVKFENQKKINQKCRTALSRAKKCKNTFSFGDVQSYNRMNAGDRI